MTRGVGVTFRGSGSKLFDEIGQIPIVTRTSLKAEYLRKQLRTAFLSAA
jgi:hypothetical protein